MTELPRIDRIRHDTRRRTLTVARTERLTPHMIRLTLAGPDLEGFHSAGFDDHIKLFVPKDGGEAMRDYTPRRFGPEGLVVDVVDHPGGPAADWARTAVAGDTLTIGGPRGSKVIGGPIDHWLLVGDETALPAIGRRIEEAPAGTAITAIVAVPSAADEQVFETKAALSIRWVHRDAAESHRAEPMMAALEAVTLPPRTFAWIAAEAGVARALRDRLVERGLPREWTAAAGYWLRGVADSAVKDL
ncbi:siderophore-interacting protein [Falsirhodobacter sp. 20TX0035]|uniref:siderophore-interacting protein n=1 Tax=Falsirhodobacter sp. 20TX0035 TaxID=3022019 RepID=UPI0023306510|nr:siderophore-interacting protein [Falsirhodobacter sp. 20TX0035]MDB6452830.1 siderophore-interacting protein [Falsirhodobacter sp. 20TX0035]